MTESKTAQMPKRKRNSSVELIAVDNNGIIIECNSKEYFVACDREYVKLFGHSDIEIDVIHNCEHKAMLNVENIRSGEIILRQEINPFKFKDIDEWVEDN